jgi:hypothetical protein
MEVSNRMEERDQLFLVSKISRNQITKTERPTLFLIINKLLNCLIPALIVRSSIAGQTYFK